MKNPTCFTLESKLFLSQERQAFITPERITLLKSVDAVGSISGGAKAVGKSYKWAWDSIDHMNSHSSYLLVQSSSGGKGGGGARLTPFAKDLIAYYDDLNRIYQNKIESYQERFNQAFEKGIFTKDIASTLHGVVRELECREDLCDVKIAYGEKLLKAKCKSNLALSEGDEIAFMVESNQIIIAKQAVEISAQNMLEGKITEILEEGKRVYLTLALPTQESLKVLITSDALRQLTLAVGQDCFAYFKTYNITILGERS